MIALYVVDQTPAAEQDYRVRFAFDPNSIDLEANSMQVYLLRGMNATPQSVLDIYMRKYDGAYQVNARMKKDDGTWGYAGWKTISDEPHELEVEWHASTSGSLILWIDGVEQARLTGLDSDTMVIESIRLGAPYISTFASGTNGSFSIDDYIAWNPSATPVAQYVYDGDSNRVKSVEGGVTIAYLGNYLEWNNATGKMKKYYYAGATRVAMRDNGTLYYLLGDHLGSTSVAYKVSTQEVDYQRYLPWGLPRGEDDISVTTFGFTGQRETSVGLMYFVARHYDPALGRFSQPDSIIPNPGDPASWNRYQYVKNSPLVYRDPSGHTANICLDDGNCNFKPHIDPITYLKKIILSQFGVTMSDDGDKEWSTSNLRSVFASLRNINKAMNQKLKSLIGGATFWLRNQNSTEGSYHGVTHLDGTGIDFYTIGDAALRQMNVYHEVGHLLDNVPGLKDVFTDAVSNEKDPSWVSSDERINPSALNSLTITNDPNYPYVQARQTYTGFGPSEQWADAFANYVAGNIRLGSTSGVAMYNFVSNALAPYIGVP